MNRLFTYTVLGILIMTGSLMAFPNMQLKGKVVNASQDSAGVANITVILQAMHQGDQQPADLDETRSNAAGEYSFPIASPDTSLSYFAAVDYQGVRYYSNGSNPAQQTIVVYDTTSGPGQIDVAMHHLIIEDLGNGIQVRETRIFNNSGDHAVSNFQTHEGIGEYTLRYALPPNAENFTPISSALLQVKDGYIYDKNVMAPGTRQSSYAYVIPYQDKKANVDLKFDMPTRSFDLFMKSTNLGVQSDQLQDMGTFNIRNAEYYRYNAADLDEGSEIQFTVVQESAPPAQAEHMHQDKSADRSPWPAIMLTSVLLLGALVIGHFRENGSAA